MELVASWYDPIYSTPVTNTVDISVIIKCTLNYRNVLGGPECKRNVNTTLILADPVKLGEPLTIVN